MIYLPRFVQDPMLSSDMAKTAYLSEGLSKGGVLEMTTLNSEISLC